MSKDSTSLLSYEFISRKKGSASLTSCYLTSLDVTFTRRDIDATDAPNLLLVPIMKSDNEQL
jgi:hypothetical protein